MYAQDVVDCDVGNPGPEVTMRIVKELWWMETHPRRVPEKHHIYSQDECVLNKKLWIMRQDWQNVTKSIIMRYQEQKPWDDHCVRLGKQEL